MYFLLMLFKTDIYNRTDEHTKQASGYQIGNRMLLNKYCRQTDDDHHEC